MKILITGSNGLVGQHLVTALLQLDIHVIGVGKGPNRLDGEHRHYEYHELDNSDGVAC